MKQTIRSIADAKVVEPADLDIAVQTISTSRSKRSRHRGPNDLDIAVQNWIDTDALRQLVDHPSDGWKLQFEIPEHTVTVTGDGIVLIGGTEERTDS